MTRRLGYLVAVCNSPGAPHASNSQHRSALCAVRAWRRAFRIGASVSPSWCWPRPRATAAGRRAILGPRAQRCSERRSLLSFTLLLAKRCHILARSYLARSCERGRTSTMRAQCEHNVHRVGRMPGACNERGRPSDVRPCSCELMTQQPCIHVLYVTCRRPVSGPFADANTQPAASHTRNTG